MAHDQRAQRLATGWLRRQRTPGFQDWQSLITWLRSSEANADAYVRLLAREITVPGRHASAHSPQSGRLFLVAAIGAIIFIGATFVIAHQLSRRSEMQISNCM